MLFFAAHAAQRAGSDPLQGMRFSHDLPAAELRYMIVNWTSIGSLICFIAVDWDACFCYQRPRTHTQRESRLAKYIACTAAVLLSSSLSCSCLWSTAGHRSVVAIPPHFRNCRKSGPKNPTSFHHHVVKVVLANVEHEFRQAVVTPRAS